MRTSTTVTCPSCDAAWDPGDARFCGDCGARLRPSPTLEGAPLSDAERTEALAPFDPHRLRCEPEGCERWRVDLPGGSRYGRQVAIIEGLVVTLAGDEVRAYDLDSGAEQWRASWPEPSAPPPVAEVALIETQVDGNGASGNAWTTLHDLRALDPRTGALLWTTGSASLRAVSDRAFVVTDGATTRVLHPRTGAERGRGELPGTGWLHLAADVLLHQSDAHDGRWQVLDTESLEVMAELGPLDHLMRTDDGSALVGLDRSDANTGDRVLLFETDGTLRWEHQVTAPAGSVADCCTNPRVEGDDLVLPPLPNTAAPLRLGLSDGTPRATSPARPGLVPAPGDEPGTWWLSPATAISEFGDDRSALLWHAGHRMEVRGNLSGPFNAAPPFIFTDGSSLLGVQPVPPG